MAIAEIINIGDELLLGHTINTNASWMGQQLEEIGVKCLHQTVISDTREAIFESLKTATSRSDIVLITGGLGPTKDDITKKCLAEFFGAKLVLDEARLREVTLYFHQRGRAMDKLNEDQALIPDNCTSLSNTIGTAPGMWFDEQGTVIVSMPGVPREMKLLMTSEVLPRIKKRFPLPNIQHRFIQTVGMGESKIAGLLSDWEDLLPPFLKLAYLPKPARVLLRLTGAHEDAKVLETALENEVKKLHGLIPNIIIGEGKTLTIEERIGQLLKEQGKRLATAESCTGGFLSHKITSISGSSSYFMGGIVSYANQVKEDLLEVSPNTLKEFGAVSEQTVCAMAQNARKQLNADYALALSGIAGPNGGSPEKPVGTVWLSLATPEQTISKKLQLGIERLNNIELASIYALDLLRKTLMGFNGEK